MNFETPTDAAAYYAGMSVAAYEAREDAIVSDLEDLYNMGEPHLEPEDRTRVSYWDVSSRADYAGLQTALDWEANHPEWRVYPRGYGE